MRRVALVGVTLLAILMAACTNAEPSSTPSAEPTAAAIGGCRQPHFWPPLTELPAIRAELERQLKPPVLMSIGDGAGYVGVGLRATEECLAASIKAVYGAKVDLTVGLFHFPLDPRAESMCGNRRGPIVAPPQIQAIPKLAAKVPQGQFFKGTVQITNIGPAPFDMRTSSNFSVTLSDADTREPVGGSEGGSIGTGLDFSLAPHTSREIEIFGGTASCDPARGYVLPAGAYEARAFIDWSSDQGVHYFWSDPAHVELVAP